MSGCVRRRCLLCRKVFYEPPRRGRPRRYCFDCGFVMDLFTYVPTWAGFVFLAVVLDVFSRRVVGWAMATHLRTELVLAALNMAIGQRRPDGVVHHSDKGTQYTSLAFGKRCREMKVVTSTGSTGDCFDKRHGGELLRHARMRAHRPAYV